MKTSGEKALKKKKGWGGGGKNSKNYRNSK